MDKMSWLVDRQTRRLAWLGGVFLIVTGVVAVFAVIFRPASHTDTPASASAPARATHPAAERASPTRPVLPGSPAPQPAATWPVAGPVPDLSVPLPGMPPVANPANIYADAGPDMLSPAG